MDSPHLLPLGFLLLALAAPHPNIAMSIVGPAERTEDYSTAVTVYCCRDCGSCTCKSWANDFANFNIIADTQNEIFSDVIIELVTNKTHTTVCFEEINSCLKQIYVVLWKRPEGSGHSCGILSSGENGRVDISTEKKTICCEAETDTRRYNPDLKCSYTQLSHPKLTTLPADIPGEGIPGNSDVPTSKMNSTDMWIGIFAVLIVLVGAGATMYYCLRLRGQAPTQDTPASEEENIQLNKEPSTRQETFLPSASSSPSLRMRSNM